MASKTRNEMAGETRPTLIMAGADKGGVGKSTLSRLLLDHFERRFWKRHLMPICCVR